MTNLDDLIFNLATDEKIAKDLGNNIEENLRLLGALAHEKLSIEVERLEVIIGLVEHQVGFPQDAIELGKERLNKLKAQRDELPAFLKQNAEAIALWIHLGRNSSSRA